MPTGIACRRRGPWLRRRQDEAAVAAAGMRRRPQHLVNRRLRRRRHPRRPRARLHRPLPRVPLLQQLPQRVAGDEADGGAGLNPPHRASRLQALPPRPPLRQPHRMPLRPPPRRLGLPQPPQVLRPPRPARVPLLQPLPRRAEAGVAGADVAGTPRPPLRGLRTRRCWRPRKRPRQPDISGRRKWAGI